MKATAVTVATTPTRLDTPGDTSSSIAIYNNGAATIYLGGPTVAVAAGVPVPAGTWGPGVDLVAGEALWGIVAAGTVEARVLESGLA